MSISNVFFTNKGKIVHTKCLTGKRLKFTKITIGNGELGGRAAQELTGLISPKLDIAITKMSTIDENKVKIGGKFDNTNLTAGFYYREIGLFAEDPDTYQEILYCYGNAGSLAEYIASQGSELIEKYIDIIAVVGNEANVTAVINSSLLSVSPEDLENHNNDPEAHGPIREWIQNLINGIKLTWSSISGKPDTFPPSSHSHSISEVTNLQNTLDNKAPASHVTDNNNPHKVTKTQVGLGNVLDYGIATTVEAQLGIATNKYMTPALVKIAVEYMSQNGVISMVKSVQRGVSDMGNNASIDVTISPVNVNKTMLNYLGFTYSSSNASSQHARRPHIRLLNSTTIRIERGESNANVPLSWEVIEFY